MMYGSWDIGHNRFFFFHFGLFFAILPPPLNNPENQNFGKMKKTPGGIITHFKHEYHKWKLYDVCCLRYGAWKTDFFLILDHFLSFYTPLPSPNNPENQNFQKMKKKTKKPGDIIILHKCTINDNHMIYGSWDMKCTRQTFFLILAICHFLPFYLPNNLKNEISKKWKKRLEISSFYTSVPKIMIIGYTVPEIWQVTDVIVIFHFGQFFAPLTTSS